MAVWRKLEVGILYYCIMRCVFLCIATPLLLNAQLSFDMASIKPGQIERAGGEGRRSERVTTSAKGVTLTNVSLSYCIQWAYDLKFYQVIGPDWVTQDRYDIAAKTEQISTKEQLQTMLQSLLAERFQWRFHKETRNIPVYELVVRKNPVKLQEAKADLEKGFGVVDGSFVFSHVTLSEFAAYLSDLAAIDRPVQDKTGLAGVSTLPCGRRHKGCEKIRLQSSVRWN